MTNTVAGGSLNQDCHIRWPCAIRTIKVYLKKTLGPIIFQAFEPGQGLIRILSTATRWVPQWSFHQPHQHKRDQLYFENNCIGRTLRHDGRYRKMTSAVAFHHPNIWKFLDVIKTEQIYESALYRNIAYAKCVRWSCASPHSAVIHTHSGYPKVFQSEGIV